MHMGLAGGVGTDPVLSALQAVQMRCVLKNAAGQIHLLQIVMYKGRSKA
jgi:hypothetical protein